MGIAGSVKTTMPSVDSQEQASKLAKDVALFIGTEEATNALVYHVKMIQVRTAPFGCGLGFASPSG